MQTKLFLYAVCLFLTQANISAQLPANLSSHLDSIFITSKNFPGIALSIIENGKIIIRKDLGMANIEHKSPFTHQTPVRLGYSGAREFICAGWH